MERIKKALLQAREQREQLRDVSVETEEATNSDIEQVRELDEALTEESANNNVVTKNVVPDVNVLERNKILYSQTPIATQRAYKMLRTRFLQRISKNNWNSIAVVSPTSDDGKTLTAINLCISIAQDPNHTSLLIDFDLLQPSIHEYFDLELEFSINDYFTENTNLESCLVSPNQPGLVLAPTKQAIEGSSEFLASQQAAKFSSELKQKYQDRVILYDLPPILVCDDALSFLPNVDAVLLVLREGKTKRSDVEATMNILEGKNIAGVVLNDSKYGISDYYY